MALDSEILAVIILSIADAGEKSLTTSTAKRNYGVR